MSCNNAATYPVRTAQREAGLYPLALTGTGASAPTVSYDPGGLVSSIVRNAAGDYTINLADSWRENSQVHCDYSSNDESYAKSHTLTFGTPSDSFGLATVVAATQDDIPVGEAVLILCVLAR